MVDTLSLDAKLIAATNMAVAEAIWQTYYLQRGGAPAQPAQQMVLRDIRQSLKELEKIAKKLVDEEADAALDASARPERPHQDGLDRNGRIH
jgi:hypothetical protein